MSNYNVETFTISETNQLFFVSDLHFFHKKIIEFTGRPTTLENLNNWIIQQCNSVIPNKHSTVLHLGDMFFSCTNEQAVEILSQLNGDWWFVLGNHDNPSKLETVINTVNKLKGTNHRCLGWYHKLLVKQEPKVKGEKWYKKLLILCHFPIEDWDSKHYGSAMIHGHCLDMATEVLTKDGWKFRKDLSASDQVASYNSVLKQMQYESIDEFVDLNYTGEVYHFKSKNVSQRTTNLHTMVGLTRAGAYIKKSAEEVYKLSEFKFITSACLSDNPGLTISDNLIRLYIAIAADGSLENTDLIRFRFKRQDKIEFIKKLLTDLNIEFRQYLRKDNVVTLNFTLPSELKDWCIKGLDKKLLNCNKDQFEIILDTYLHTDGTDYNSYKAIYTSKKSECDIISHLATVHGYTCTTTIREANENSSESYTLYLKDQQTSVMSRLKNQTVVENVIQEPFWCLKTKYQNFFIRRDGKVSLTGNCHGGGSDHDGKGLSKIPNRFDVGIDNSHTFTPFSFEDVKRILRKTRDV